MIRTKISSITLLSRFGKWIGKLTLATLAAITLTAGMPGVARAEAAIVKIKENNKIDPNGDAHFINEITLPAGAYTNLKRNTTNTAVLLRKLGLSQENWVAVEGIKGDWDDGASTVRIEFHTRGAVRVGNDGHWEAPLFDGADLELVAVQDGVAVLTSALTIPGFGLATCTTRVTLPRGAGRAGAAPAG